MKTILLLLTLLTLCSAKYANPKVEKDLRIDSVKTLLQGTWKLTSTTGWGGTQEYGGVDVYLNFDDGTVKKIDLTETYYEDLYAITNIEPSKNYQFKALLSMSKQKKKEVIWVSVSNLTITPHRVLDGTDFIYIKVPDIELLRSDHLQGSSNL